MAFDLVIWKWATDSETVDPKEVIEALDEDNSHPALQRFDREAFESALRNKFGDVNEEDESPFLYEVFDFKGVPANWIYFSVNWSQVEQVCPMIAEIAKSQELAVYDPQENRMV